MEVGDVNVEEAQGRIVGVNGTMAVGTLYAAIRVRSENGLGYSRYFVLLRRLGSVCKYRRLDEQGKMVSPLARRRIKCGL